VLVPLAAYLESCRGPCHGLSSVDSTKLVVCHNRRIKHHRVFAGLAERGKDSVDWFYGFKLHLVVNDCDDLLACHLTPENADDRRPLPQLAQRLIGLADRGYRNLQALADSGKGFRNPQLSRITATLLAEADGCRTHRGRR
jgi:Transposase DDE domain